MIISIAAQKGGVGKSTIAINLSAVLKRKGYRVLLIDLDGQQTSTIFTGAEKNQPKNSCGLFDRNTTLTEEYIKHTETADIIPSSKEMYTNDYKLLNLQDKEYMYILRNSLKPVKDNYDFIILDTPPSLGATTISSLTASDYVIIPVNGSVLSVNGAVDLITAQMKTVASKYNKNLKSGVILSRWNNRGGIMTEIRELIERLGKAYGFKVFTTTIREAVAVVKAQSNQQSVIEYSPKATVTEDFSAFADELIKTLKG